MADKVINNRKAELWSDIFQNNINPVRPKKLMPSIVQQVAYHVCFTPDTVFLGLMRKRLESSIFNRILFFNKAFVLVQCLGEGLFLVVKSR